MTSVDPRFRNTDRSDLDELDRLLMEWLHGLESTVNGQTKRAAQTPTMCREVIGAEYDHPPTLKTVCERLDKLEAIGVVRRREPEAPRFLLTDYGASLVRGDVTTPPQVDHE